jgi:enoyl-CoA hydratase
MALTTQNFGPHIVLAVEGVVARLLVDKPPLNLLSKSVVTDLSAALRDIAARSDLRVLILSGGGERAFIAGVDVNDMVMFNTDSARHFITLLHSCMASLRRLPIPVIGRINGYALGGGCEMAMACDLRIASTRAQFGMPEVRLGIPSVIEAALMPIQIGATRAMELLLTGKMIDAATAQQWGLVNRVVADAELDRAIDEEVQMLLQSGPRAIAAQKQLFYEWMDSTLSHSIRLGIDAFTRAYTSEEPREGMRAFQNKRRPHWSPG